MSVRILPPPMAVAPGTTASGQLLVRNGSAIVESYRLEVLEAAAWIRIVPDEVSLFPGQEATCALEVAPPASPAVAAGTHRIGVRALGATDGAGEVVETDVSVAEYDALTITSRPSTVRAYWRATMAATVTNTGNTARRVWFGADEPDDLLRLRVRPAHAVLAPGQSAMVRVRGRFLTRPNRGERLGVTLTAAHDTARAETYTNVMLRSSILFRAIAFAVALVAVALIALATLGGGQPVSSAIAGTSTTRVTAAATTVATTAASATTVAAPTTTVAATTTAAPTTTAIPAATTTSTTTVAGRRPPATTTTTAPPLQAVNTIRFDDPNAAKGTPDVLLTGNEFASRGVTLFGAPVSDFCAEATRVALLATNPFGAPAPFLTTTTGTDLRECNTVPVGIRFARPVKKVTLTFWGANVDYTLTARDSGGRVSTTATARPVCCRTPRTITVTGTGITDVTFGAEKAVTAVTQIVFEL